VQPVVLDTDVASLAHRRRLPAPLAARLAGRRPIITFVTLGELTKWMHVRQWGSRSRQEMADCLTHDLPLATLNIKDFSDFAEHHGLRLITAE
jgi:predicted nucleic acid-binding protein